jgi:hypothetical protein
MSLLRTPPQQREVYRMPEGPEWGAAEADWGRVWVLLGVFEEITAELGLLRLTDYRQE